MARTKEKLHPRTEIDVRLTAGMIDALFDAAAYHETVLEDNNDTNGLNRLNRACQRLAAALRDKQ